MMGRIGHARTATASQASGHADIAVSFDSDITDKSKAEDFAALDDLNVVVVGESPVATVMLTTVAEDKTESTSFTLTTDEGDSYTIKSSDTNILAVDSTSNPATITPYEAGTATLYVYGTDGETVIGQKEVTVVEEEREFDHIGITEAFENGGDFAYDGETTVTDEDEKEGTDLYGTMTVQAYDTYGDKYNENGSYSETLTWINGWFKETKDGVNMWELDNSNGKLLTYTSDVSSGSATLTVDTTKLDDVSDWENTYGNSFTIIAGCGGSNADGSEWKAENLGKTIEVTFTVTNVSNKASTYELTLDGPDGTYDLTRAYDADEGSWSFTNLEEGSTFDGTATGTVGPIGKGAPCLSLDYLRRILFSVKIFVKKIFFRL